MNKILVTRASHPATFKKCKNLGQLIAAIEKEGESQNQYVVKIYLNNKRMDEDEEKLLDSLSINEVDSLEIHLAKMNEIIRNSIIDIIAAIQQTQMQAIRFCKEFRESQKLDDEKVKYILIQCRGVINSLEEIFKTHISGQFQIKHHSLWLESEKELTNILQCILQSRRLSDVDFVSDLIEYDLVQALDSWEEVLEKELIDNPNFTGIFSLKNDRQNGDNGLDA